jgi:hypothetical protein
MNEDKIEILSDTTSTEPISKEDNVVEDSINNSELLDLFNLVDKHIEYLHNSILTIAEEEKPDAKK